MLASWAKMSFELQKSQWLVQSQSLAPLIIYLTLKHSNKVIAILPKQIKKCLSKQKTDIKSLPKRSCRLRPVWRKKTNHTSDYWSYWLRRMSSLLHSSLNLLKNTCQRWNCLYSIWLIHWPMKLATLTNHSLPPTSAIRSALSARMWEDLRSHPCWNFANPK